MYVFNATVNYPETKEADTPTFQDLTLDRVVTKVRKLLLTEPDATSFVITIVKQAE